MQITISDMGAGHRAAAFHTNPTAEHRGAGGCCGGEAPNGSGACCALDAEVKSGGGIGCGCGAAFAEPGATSRSGGCC